MQCVILVAGKGTRMMPLTADTPKPLLKINGKALLDHIVEALPPLIDEIVLVTHYLEEQFREHCGDEYFGKKITYVHQEDCCGGTGDALMVTKDVIKGKFLFMYGDDIHGAEALQKAVACDHAIICAESETPEKYGVLELNTDGTLKRIHEKPKNPPSNMVNLGGFVANESIFECEACVSELGEILATDMFSEYAAKNPVSVIKQDLWIPVGCPEDIPKAEKILE